MTLNSKDSVIYFENVDSWAKLFLVLYPHKKTLQPVLTYCICI